MGYLDVTNYAGVDPSGNKDSTVGLQKAIDDAAKGSLIAFFPSGTYKISKTLDGANGRGNRKCGAHINSVVLIGSKRGLRPTIRLADNSPGFNNPDRPVPVVHIYRWKPKGERPPCSFSNGLRGIDINVGKGNPGAIGLKFGGAQESFLEDVRIYATGGFAGISSIPGRGMASANLEVEGGQYGLYLHSSFNGHLGSSVAGIVMRNQTKRAIYAGVWGGLVVTGFRIEADQGPVVETMGNASNPGNLVLLDGSIELAKPGLAINNPGGASVHVRNLFTKGVKGLAKSKGRDVKSIPANGWTHVKTFSYTPPHKRAAQNGLKVKSWSLVNSNRTQGQLIEYGPMSQPPANLVSQHVFLDIPTFEDADAVNARDHGVTGDGKTNDTKALQAVIDKHDKVFLPKGKYMISAPIRLRAKTQLFGTPARRTTLDRAKSWKPTKQVWMIETVNDADATTYLGDILLESRHRRSKKSEKNFISAVHWRAGRHSVLNNVWLPNLNYWGDLPRQLFRVSGNGGGRWYRWGDHGRMWETGHPEARQLLIEGTKEPFTIYGANPEHARVSPYIEVRNARNVRLLGNKTENIGFDVVHINRSENVLVAGISQIKIRRGCHVVVVNNSRNVELLNFSPIVWDPKGAVVLEKPSGASVGGQEYLSMYRLGKLNESAWQFDDDVDEHVPAVPRGLRLKRQ